MDKKNKKIELLEAGATAIQVNGYHGTGVQQIVEAAGVPKGSFYNYFKSKEDFVINAMQHLSSEPLSAFAQSLQKGAHSPRQRIIDTFQDKVDGFAEERTFTKGCLVGNMCQELADTHPAIAEKAECLFRNYTAVLARCLREAQAAGEIRQTHDPEQLAEFLFNSWEGAMMRMKSSRSAQPLNAFIETLDRILEP